VGRPPGERGCRLIAPSTPRPTLAEQAFETLARVARSGIWINSHVAARQSVEACRCWGDVLDYLRQQSAFLHVACDAYGLPFGRSLARWQFLSIGRTAGVRGCRQFTHAAFAYCRGPRGEQKLFVARAELSIKDADDDVLDADPVELAYAFAFAKIRNAEYRQRTASRLAAIFQELGIRQLRDLQPGRLLGYFDKQIRLESMHASTANAYRTAVWKFCRWLVVDRKFYAFARTLAELDAQGVNQTALIRGKRQQTFRRRAGKKGGASND